MRSLLARLRAGWRRPRLCCWRRRRCGTPSVGRAPGDLLRCGLGAGPQGPCPRMASSFHASAPYSHARASGSSPVFIRALASSTGTRVPAMTACPHCTRGSMTMAGFSQHRCGPTMRSGTPGRSGPAWMHRSAVSTTSTIPRGSDVRLPSCSAMSARTSTSARVRSVPTSGYPPSSSLSPGLRRSAATARAMACGRSPQSLRSNRTRYASTRLTNDSVRAVPAARVGSMGGARSREGTALRPTHTHLRSVLRATSICRAACASVYLGRVASSMASLVRMAAPLPARVRAPRSRSCL